MAQAPVNLDDDVYVLQNPWVREAIEDGVAVTSAGHEARSAKDRQVLAHVGYLAADPEAEVADRELAHGERLEDAQALRIRQRSTDGRIALAVDIRRKRQVVQHG